MSAARDGDVIRLAGDCGVEDAEPLAALCRAAPGLPVDLAGATSLHTAVVQVLLERAPPLRGVPADAFAAELVLPALRRAADRALKPAPERAKAARRTEGPV